MKIKDIIKKLEELNDEEYTINMEIEPIVNRYENISGNGVETIRYQYTIILTGKEVSRRYKTVYGKIEYIQDKENIC